MGIVVPRHSHTAIARNQLKRRLRDLVRIYLLDADVKLDVIVLANRDAYLKTFEELRSEIGRVATIVEGDKTL